MGVVMAKREQTSVRFDHVQVDSCPDEAGMILSVGAISMWLPEATVREVVSKLQACLRESSHSIAGRAPRFGIDGSN
jgi:hypothetical protein